MEKEIKNIEEEIKNYSDSSTGGIEKFRINFVSKNFIGQLRNSKFAMG